MRILMTLILIASTIFCYAQNLSKSSTILGTKSTTPVYTSIYTVSEMNENNILIKQSTAIPNISYTYLNKTVKINLIGDYYVVLDTSFLCVPIKSEKSNKSIVKKLTIKN